jgi:hypothetical protein
MVVMTMFRKTHSVKVLIIEPVDICMGIVRITCSTVDLTAFHRPQVGHYINIMLCDI